MKNKWISLTSHSILNFEIRNCFLNGICTYVSTFSICMIFFRILTRYGFEVNCSKEESIFFAIFPLVVTRRYMYAIWSNFVESSPKLAVERGDNFPQSRIFLPKTMDLLLQKIYFHLCREKIISNTTWWILTFSAKKIF